MASSRNYRPRPIDVRKHMPIVRELSGGRGGDGAGEVSIMGEDGNMEESVMKNTGMSVEDAEEKNFVQAFQASVARMMGEKGGSDIPIPGLGIDKGYAATFKSEGMKAFHQSTSYVRAFSSVTDKGADATFDKLVQYEMELDDENWLAAHNEKSKVGKITEEQFEAVIDRFEKEYAAYDKLPLHRAERLVASTMLRAALIKELFDYWEAKRKRRQMPLLRCFQLPTEPSDSDAAKTFRPREKEVSIRRRLRKQQNDKDAFQKLHKIQAEFAQARKLVDLVVNREAMKLDWLKARFELIQAELERNPTLYYVIHGKPYVPPKTKLTVRKPNQAKLNKGGLQLSPRQQYEQGLHKKRKLMRRICMPDRFKLQFKRGLELGPAQNLREQLLLCTLAPVGLGGHTQDLQHRALFSRARIGVRRNPPPTRMHSCALNHQFRRLKYWGVAWRGVT
jgi:hypothetical protein